jgi:hypothetical protein
MEKTFSHSLYQGGQGGCLWGCVGVKRLVIGGCMIEIPPAPFRKGGVVLRGCEY